MYKLSIIIPVYNSQKTIKDVVEKIENAIPKINTGLEYEIILVNDNSKDGSLQVVKNICNKNNKVKLINFSKNFGQAHALMAGFKFVTGDYIVCLDDDLQTPPEEMTKLITEIIDKDLDVVYAKYKEMGQSKFRNAGAYINHLMQMSLINKPHNIYTSSYFVAKRFIIDEILKYDKIYPYIPGLIFRVTHNVGNVIVGHHKREFGKSNYTFKKLLSLWLNGFTNFSVKPLRISSIVGVFLSLVSFLFIIFLVTKKLIQPSVQIGWTSLMVTVMFFGGIQLMSIGLLGEYVGRMFLCINKTPQYVIRETYNINGEENVKCN